MSGWTPTHWIPAAGLEARATPDPAVAPSARLDPWLEVSVVQTWGDWAQVVCANGWWGWVDGRALVAHPGGPVPSAPAAPVPVPGVAGAGESTTFAARAAAGWIPLVGAALYALASVLPWLKANGRSANAFDVPLEFLLSYKSTTDLGTDLGVLLLALAVAGAAAVLLTPKPAFRRATGSVALAVALLYVVQVQQLLGAVDAPGRPGLFSALGFGVYLALVGAVVLAWAPEWPVGRARQP